MRDHPASQVVLRKSVNTQPCLFDDLAVTSHFPPGTQGSFLYGAPKPSVCICSNRSRILSVFIHTYIHQPILTECQALVGIESDITSLSLTTTLLIQHLVSTLLMRKLEFGAETNDTSQIMQSGNGTCVIQIRVCLPFQAMPVQGQRSRPHFPHEAQQPLLRLRFLFF